VPEQNKIIDLCLKHRGFVLHRQARPHKRAMQRHHANQETPGRVGFLAQCDSCAEDKGPIRLVRQYFLCAACKKRLSDAGFLVLRSGSIMHFG